MFTYTRTTGWPSIDVYNSMVQQKVLIMSLSDDFQIIYFTRSPPPADAILVVALKRFERASVNGFNTHLCRASFHGSFEYQLKCREFHAQRASCTCSCSFTIQEVIIYTSNNIYYPSTGAYALLEKVRVVTEEVYTGKTFPRLYNPLKIYAKTVQYFCVFRKIKNKTFLFRRYYSYWM